MQRIAIARAQYKKSAILILDESISALDPLAESELFKKFTDMSEGKTTILVSHRIYSTRFCDKIAVLDKGEEYGTFDELIDKMASIMICSSNRRSILNNATFTEKTNQRELRYKQH